MKKNQFDVTDFLCGHILFNNRIWVIIIKAKSLQECRMSYHGYWWKLMTRQNCWIVLLIWACSKYCGGKLTWHLKNPTFKLPYPQKTPQSVTPPSQKNQNQREVEKMLSACDELKKNCLTFLIYWGYNNKTSECDLLKCILWSPIYSGILNS